MTYLLPSSSNPPPQTSQQAFHLSGEYDRTEARRYGGVWARDLAEDARDHAAMGAGRKRPGMAARFTARTEHFVRALWAYLAVKSALRLWRRPLQEGYRSRGAQDVLAEPSQRRHWFWRTPPPSVSDRAARNGRYGFDVRATSPTHIRRAVYTERAKLRAALAGPLTEAKASSAKSSRVKPAFIGPPAPRDYKDSNDAFMVWPPVFIGGEPDSFLPIKGGGGCSVLQKRGSRWGCETAIDRSSKSI